MTQVAFILEGGDSQGEVGSVGIVYRSELLEGEATALNLTHVSDRFYGQRGFTELPADLPHGFAFVSR